MNLDAYLERIGYAGPRAPTLETLRAITRLHATTIPFENLSVLIEGPPDLELPALEAKLVDAGRGGYCYEQNGLLAAALVALGFGVQGLSARVRYGVPPDVVTPRSHRLMRVETPEGVAFADVGFGGLTLTAPVMMRWQEEQDTPHERVRLVPAEDDFLLQALVGEAWTDVYRFDLAVHLPPDYVQQNWHTATRPNGLFGNNLIAAMPMPEGTVCPVQSHADLAFAGGREGAERGPLEGRTARGPRRTVLDRGIGGRTRSCVGGGGPHDPASPRLLLAARPLSESRTHPRRRHPCAGAQVRRRAESLAGSNSNKRNSVRISARGSGDS